ENAEMIVISLGTGSLTRVFEYEDAKNWGGLGWINPNNDVPAIASAMDGQSSAANQNMEFLLGDQFIRLDAPLKDDEDPDEAPNDAFDDASPENILKVQRLADRIIEQNSDKIDRVVDVLRVRMHQKDLQRGPRPALPDAELAAAVADNEPEDFRSRMMGWLRNTGILPGETKNKDLGWDGGELEKRRRSDAAGQSPHANPPHKSRTMQAEESEIEALRAIAHRFGKMAGKKPKLIDQEIDAALEAARTAAEEDRMAAAESAEAIAELEARKTDDGHELPPMAKVVHSDDLDAPRPANLNEIEPDGGDVAEAEADAEPPVSWRSPVRPEDRPDPPDSAPRP
ncbi:MAG: hypothetical protein AAF556_04715, partial [Pseudomonadota bacterium]